MHCLIYGLNSDVNGKANETVTGDYGITCTARKTGNLVFLRVTGSVSANMPARSYTTVGTLSANYRPSVATPANTFVQQSSGEIFALRVTTSGEVQIYPSINAITSGTINIVTVYSLIN